MSVVIVNDKSCNSRVQRHINHIAMGTCYDASIQYYDADLDALYTVYSIMYDKIWETSTIHPSCEYVGV